MATLSLSVDVINLEPIGRLLEVLAANIDKLPVEVLAEIERLTKEIKADEC